ncbi:MAG TPA: hypothetical protein VHW71_13735 [Steroidobacteraceae bacterium]|jgi:hypothetical protein|nr:hypothetical protein [Steroidobacteraceae bacterium]
MHSSTPGFQSKIPTLYITLVLVTLWLVMHGYHGFTGDGQIYAFQAFARLHPPLAADLYLQNTSQDQFTIFSPLYAKCIGLLGLENAGRLLTLLFTLWFLAAAWSFVTAVTRREGAWLAVAALLVAAGGYGASAVFQILDPFLTARLPAEALIVTALACHFRGMKRLGLLMALGSMLIHPLMALPGMILLICLWLPIRVSVIGAIGGILATLTFAVAATNSPLVSHVVTVMDAPWLAVVRERSQFLFLQLWSAHDWGINGLPFISLGLTASVMTEERIRKLCATAALVGAAGLAIAFIGDLIGPIAILMQGQGWRWVWTAVFIGIALAPLTALQLWGDKEWGPLCALLLISGWVLSGLGGTACISLASILWLTRGRLGSRQIRRVSGALGAIVVTWIAIKCWAVVLPAQSPGRSHFEWAQVRDSPAARIAGLLSIALVWRLIRASRTTWVSLIVSLLFAALLICSIPTAFRQPRKLAATADIDEFVDWASIIPPSSTVLVVPPRDVGAFVWFTLRRPNYLALDQSSGVVFSRRTALEVRRRSEVLLPLMDPDWKILTKLHATASTLDNSAPSTRRLTAEYLMQICADPLLGFVVSPEDVGFDPLRHEHAGAWNGWELYNCGKVRAVPSTT